MNLDELYIKCPYCGDEILISDFYIIEDGLKNYIHCDNLVCKELFICIFKINDDLFPPLGLTFNEYIRKGYVKYKCFKL